MKVDFQQAVNFILKWLAIAVVLHFGFKLGEFLDRMIPAI